MRARIDRDADFGEVLLHRVGVGVGHHKAGGLALRRADRAEDAGPHGALVVRRTGPGPAPRPPARDPVLLTCARVRHGPRTVDVYVDRLPWRTPATRARWRSPGAAWRGSPPARRKGLFERLERLRVLRVIPRTGGELPEPHPAQLAPERLPAERDLERVLQPAYEVAKPPAHDAMKLGLRPSSTAFASAARCSSFRSDGWPGGLRSKRPVGVEAHHPIPDDLEPHAADPRGLRSARAVVDRQSQQSSRLRRVPARPRKTAQIVSSMIRPQDNRLPHREPHSVLHGETRPANLRNPLRESASPGAGLRGRNVRARTAGTPPIAGPPACLPGDRRPARPPHRQAALQWRSRPRRKRSSSPNLSLSRPTSLHRGAAC